jgi:hypothetical protein
VVIKLYWRKISIKYRCATLLLIVDFLKFASENNIENKNRSIRIKYINLGQDTGLISKNICLVSYLSSNTLFLPETTIYRWMLHQTFQSQHPYLLT